MLYARLAHVNIRLANEIHSHTGFNFYTFSNLIALKRTSIQSGLNFKQPHRQHLNPLQTLSYYGRHTDAPMMEKEIHASIEAKYYPSISEAVKDAFRTLLQFFTETDLRAINIHQFFIDK